MSQSSSWDVSSVRRDAAPCQYGVHRTHRWVASPLGDRRDDLAAAQGAHKVAGIKPRRREPALPSTCRPLGRRSLRFGFRPSIRRFGISPPGTPGAFPPLLAVVACPRNEGGPRARPEADEQQRQRETPSRPGDDDGQRLVRGGLVANPSPVADLGPGQGQRHLTDRYPKAEAYADRYWYLS